MQTTQPAKTPAQMQVEPGSQVPLQEISPYRNAAATTHLMISTIPLSLVTIPLPIIATPQQRAPVSTSQQLTPMFVMVIPGLQGALLSQTAMMMLTMTVMETQTVMIRNAVWNFVAFLDVASLEKKTAELMSTVRKENVVSLEGVKRGRVIVNWTQNVMSLKDVFLDIVRPEKGTAKRIATAITLSGVP